MTSVLGVMEHTGLWFGVIMLTPKWQFNSVPIKLTQKCKHLTGISIHVVHSVSEFEVKQLSRPQHQR